MKKTPKTEEEALFFKALNALHIDFSFDEGDSSRYDRLDELYGVLFEHYQDNYLDITLPSNTLKKVNDYDEIDLWASIVIHDFRQSPNIYDYFMRNPDRYHPNDWYMTIERWVQFADQAIAKDNYWGGENAFVKVNYGKMTVDDRAKAVKWFRGWLDHGGFDSEGYEEIYCHFLAELPELTDDMYGVRHAISAYNAGLQAQATQYLREQVLSIPDDSWGKHCYDFESLKHYPPEIISAIFSNDELQAMHADILHRLATKNAMWFFQDFEDFSIVAEKLGWKMVIEVMRNHPALAHFLWRQHNGEDFVMLVDKILDDLNGWLTSVFGLDPNVLSLLAQNVGDFHRGFTAGGLQGMHAKDLLAWTAMPDQHDFVRPYFAQAIRERLHDDNTFDERDNCLAIGWSRMRRKQMQVLLD